MASESECEDESVPCHAALVGWENESGGTRLADAPCTVRGSEFSMLLQEDCPAGVTRVGVVHCVSSMQHSTCKLGTLKSVAMGTVND